MEVSGVRHCQVWLHVLKAGPSVLETDSMLIGAEVVSGGFTRCERQSTALILAPDIHSNVMLQVAYSSLYLFTLIFAFFPFKKW